MFAQTTATKNKGTIYHLVLIAGAVTSLFAMTGALLSIPASRDTGMYIESADQVLKSGDTFSVQVIVVSDAPVNAFAGKLVFNRDVLAVEKIDYNTSIADLWAEAPWYNEGDGTLNFIGGTTKPGGFTGAGSLLTVTFKALTPGSGKMGLVSSKILLHDGLGTEAILTAPIDTIFTVLPDKGSIATTPDTFVEVTVTRPENSTDFNSDGTTDVRDISIFMIHLATANLRSDFNDDKKVTISDLSIILNARK